MNLASDKQRYACKMIYNYLHHKGVGVIFQDSEDFADKISAKDAFEYIKNNTETYKEIKTLLHKNRLNNSGYISYYYDNPFQVTDWSDCYDYGVSPWGNS